MAETGRAVRRVAPALIALVLLVAAAGVLLPRLLTGRTASGPRGWTVIPHLPEDWSSWTTSPSQSPWHSPVFFPTLGAGGGSMDWGTGGTLVEKDGCLFLKRRRDDDPLVLWPYRWSVDRGLNDVLRILDARGTPVLEVGDYVVLHGGGWSYEPDYVEKMIDQPLPVRCRAENYFVTSGQILERIPASAGVPV